MSLKRSFCPMSPFTLCLLSPVRLASPSSCCLALDSSSSFPCPTFRAIAKSDMALLYANMYLVLFLFKALCDAAAPESKLKARVFTALRSGLNAYVFHPQDLDQRYVPSYLKGPY
ncbi:hypothetical protein STEG23_017145 [Scotinomys teguina]